MTKIAEIPHDNTPPEVTTLWRHIIQFIIIIIIIILWQWNSIIQNVILQQYTSKQ